MRRLCLLSVVTVLLGTASAAVAANASSAPSTTSAAGLVRAAGGPYLTDSAGRRLEFHGVNLVAKCGGGAIPQPALGTPCVGPLHGPQPAFVLTPSARDPGRRFTAHDAATLARLGFNVIRLGIIWEGLEPGPPGVAANDPRYCAAQPAGQPFPSLGAADPYRAAVVAAYLQRVARTVALLAEHGISVILDMHQDAYGSAFSNPGSPVPWNGEGAPPWATCTNSQPFVAPPLWPAAYSSSPVMTAIHHFFANDVRGDLEGQLGRVWRAVAAYFRGNPAVLGYEIYNEPVDLASKSFDPELQCFYGGPAAEPVSCRASGARAPRTGLIGAIQSADPGHVVFYEPAVTTDFGAAETIGIAEPLRFRNLALAFHVYSDPAVTLPLVAGERARTRVLGEPGGPPSIMDEFGASADAAGTANTVNHADAGNLSWSYWSGLQLHDPTGSPTEALLDEHTRRPGRATALALAMPYPAATAGRPGPQVYDARTRVFRYRYSSDARIAAPTQIEVPRYIYPAGYRLTVSGAAVLSRRNAAVLLLAGRRPARTVALIIRPR